MQSDQGRNKGMRKDAGQIIKGTLRQAGLKIKASSIPSKIQNVIYNNHHRPAFGNSQERFHTFTHSKPDATPGPGNYNTNFISTKIDSKKGSGYLASQSDLNRLNYKRNFNPGPGRYQVTKPLLSNLNSTASMRSKEQSRQLFKNELQNAKQRPSPGDYEERLIRSISAATNIFKSNHHRFQLTQTDTPGVGAYNWELIKNKVKSLRFSSNKDTGQTARTFRQSYVDQLMKVKVDPKSELGPGRYNANLLATTRTFTFSKDKLDKVRTKPFVQDKTNEEIEIGPIIKERSESSHKTKQQKGGHVSVFKSKTRRYQFGQNQSKIFSDPRKYSPMIQKKHSHLLNFGNKWV